MVKLRFFLVSAFVLFMLAGCKHKQKDIAAKPMAQITDMAGRKVWVPRDISTIFCSDVTGTIFMYSLAPDKLIGRNTATSDRENEFTTKRFRQLPVLGRIFNGHSELNIETLIRLKPDILLCPLFNFTSPADIKCFEKIGAEAGIPVVMISLEMNKLAASYLFMGRLLYCQKSAKVLSDYCRETLAWAASFRRKVKKPVSVYVAEGTNGLQTIPAVSDHSETIKLAGVKNCADLDEAYGFKDMSIDFEQVLKWNPDYILIDSRSLNVKEKDVHGTILSDRLWSQLAAVRLRHILIVPNMPFNWIDRPPSSNRLIGIRWLSAKLYPDLCAIDLKQEIVKYYSLFYHVQLSKNQVNQLIQ
jgi:iron complex transport system substrate-binding protein